MKNILKNNERLDDLQINNLYIIQNPDEYLFTGDAVALGNFAHVSNMGKMVDLCSGSGIVGILVNAKNKVSEVVLVELQSVLADMSERSIEYNGIKNIKVVNSKLQGVNEIIGKGIYDCVTCNPPYKTKDTTNNIGAKPSISMCKHEISVTLEEIVVEANKLLKFGGDFYVCYKEERLAELIYLCKKYKLEPKELKILKSEKGASTILLKCRKGGKSGMKISF